MPKIVITHKVADVERWQKGKAERAASGRDAPRAAVPCGVSPW